MRITKIDTIPISFPLEEEAFDATIRWREFNFLLVKVISDEGLIGFSDIAPLHEKEMTIYETIIKSKLKEKVIGENPYNIEKIWMKMIGIGSGAYALGKTGAIVTAASAIEVALWDILSKSFNIPLYNLLGGQYRENVELYASFMGQPPIEKIKEVIDKGFKKIKVKVGFDVKNDVEYIKEIRENLGYDFELMVDANQGYNLNQAIEFAKKVTRFKIVWFEEPINILNIEGLRILSSKIDIPIALGENYYTIYDFLTVMRNNIVHIIQPDINHAGGINQIRKISSIAEAYDIKLSPHLHSLIGFTVGLHVLTASPIGYIAEYPIYGGRWGEESNKIIKRAIIIENGFAKIVSSSGIGIDFDEI
ncbi:MAG: mandelate racemase/muconate lactonizing enzyme family protein [Candidatus Micrarchaeia archaeon]